MVRSFAVLFAFLLAGCQASGSLVLDLSQVPEVNHVELWALTPTEPGTATEDCRALARGVLEPTSEAVEVIWNDEFDVEAEPPAIGLLPAGETLFLARLRDGGLSRCPVVGSACEVVSLEDGESVAVTLVAEPVAPPSLCDEAFVCDDGACRSCLEDAECDDDDACTVDTCDEGECVFVETTGCESCADADACDDADPCTVDTCVDEVCVHTLDESIDEDDDGHALDRCGGDDCDDGDASVHPGADARCGRGVDHDCNGVIDDEEGCDGCRIDDASTLGPLTSVDVDARRGLAVIGPDPAAEEPTWTLYALSPTELSVATLRADGTHEISPPVLHGVADPLPPVIAGGQLFLVDASPSYTLTAFDRNALASGEAMVHSTGTPPWGSPYSMVVSGGWLYVTANPSTLWSVDLRDLPDAVLPTSPAVAGSSIWRNCTDMLSLGDALVCIEAFLTESKLVAVLPAGDGTATPHRFIELLDSEPVDLVRLRGVPDGDRFAIAHRFNGLRLFEVSDLERPVSEWTRDWQQSQQRIPFPGPCTREDCELLTDVAAVDGGVVALTRDDNQADPASLWLYLVQIVDRESSLILSRTRIARTGSVVGREEFLHHAGSLVFVAVTRDDGTALVEVSTVTCTAP